MGEEANIFGNKKEAREQTRSNAMKIAEQKTIETFRQFVNTGQLPSYTDNEGKWIHGDRSNQKNWWTAGFLPASLWELSDIKNGNPQNKSNSSLIADSYVRENPLKNLQSHDIGFIAYGILVEGYKRTNNKKYKKMALDAARQLAQRSTKKSKIIRSWGNENSVIIDSLMNLKLLYWAAQNGGDPELTA